MNATKRNLGNIFDLITRFIAPLYQRPYVWTQEKNWEPLWASVVDVAERRLNNESSRPYFLGAIVLDQLKTSTGDVEARQIIDGQQRLTTLQILMAVVRDFCKESGSQLHESFKRLTENIITVKKTPDSVFKVWPTNADQPYFCTVMTGGERSDDHAFFDAYDYFDGELREWVAQKTTPDKIENVLLCLYSAIREDLALVVIDLDKEDDAQLIFETLNALGTPLLPADLVKNFLFHGLQNGSPSGDEQAEEAYQKYWQEFDEESPYWRSEIRQGRLKRPRIDLYLHHYVTLKAKKEILAVHLFTVFKDYVKTSSISMMDHIRLFKEYSDVYQAFDDYEKNSREGLFFNRLKDLDTSTVFPLLLEVFKNPVSREDLHQILDDLESYLIRRAICHYTNKSYNNIFLEMLKNLSMKGFNAANIRAFLESREGESSKWPSDAEVEQAVLHLSIYRKSRKTAQVVLKGYERFLRNKRTEKVEIDDDTLTIEHIMPQEWRKKWAVEEKDPLERLEAEAQRDELIHTFGNLTLITEKLNSTQSNKPWVEKKEKLQKYSALTMNRAIYTMKEWDDEAIRKRSRDILDYIFVMWKRPPVIESSRSSEEEIPVRRFKPSSSFNGKVPSEVIRYLKEQRVGVSMDEIAKHLQGLGYQSKTFYDALNNLAGHDLVSIQDTPAGKRYSLKENEAIARIPVKISGGPGAEDLIREFNELIEAEEDHPLHRRLSYPYRNTLLKAVSGMSWRDAWENQGTLTKWLSSYGGKLGGPLSEGSIKFVWSWVARAFEHACRQGVIPENPFRGLLSEKELLLNP